MTDNTAQFEQIAAMQDAGEPNMFALAEQMNALEPGAGLGFVNEALAGVPPSEIASFLDGAAVIFPAMTLVLMASALVMGFFMMKSV